MHTAQNTQSNQSNGNNHVPNRPPPPRPTPVNQNSGKSNRLIFFQIELLIFRFDGIFPSFFSANRNIPPPRPVNSPAPVARNPQQSTIPPQQVAHDSINSGGAGGLFSFSSIKGGAGSLFKNLKDTSSKVIQQVQQTIARTDLDISSITSRIIVMPCPSEGLESTYKTNNIEDVKVYIDSRYALGKVSVYNFGPRSCPRLPPPVRTVEGSFIFPLANKAPLLQGMYSLVEDMFGFLSADPKSIVIIQSADNGRATAATMVNKYFAFVSQFYNIHAIFFRLFDRLVHY